MVQYLWRDSIVEDNTLYIDLARAKSEALFDINSFFKENIKSSNAEDKVKTTGTVKTK